MSEVLGIVAVAVLFAVFGLLRGRAQDGAHGCGSCSGEDDPETCHACRHGQDGMAVRR